MIKQIQMFLGPARAQALVLWLGITGLASLALNTIVDQYEWVRPVQTLLVLVFFIGAAVIIGGRMTREERLRWLAILSPSIGALLLAVTVLPNLALPLVGAAAGWIVAGMFLFRQRVPREFQEAVRHFRKGRYEEAVGAMGELIKADPENEHYYRFRAEIFRIWGKLDRARRDYERMAQIVPTSAVAYNGLAEVFLQSGRYAEAQDAAQRALELAPDEWVAAYNLGMINDRTGASEHTVAHLQRALALKVPDARHRLLIHLYLARAYSRQGDLNGAERALANLKRHRHGLEEWQSLLNHPEAAALRAVLEADVQTAADLIGGKLDVNALAARSAGG